ncbi:hypothetical protein [Mycetohabitans sp. B46]|uniref:hypothetical protein n=1 Tax=Mycetohabitans sp. B46 TaxID=2772536 RepID=UPI00307F6003
MALRFVHFHELSLYVDVRGLSDEFGFGLYADFRGLGDALGFGLYADIRGLGDALRLSLYADFRGLGDALGFGLYADIRGLGDALRLGLYADIRGLGDALRLGLYADVRGLGDALGFGLYAGIRGLGDALGLGLYAGIRGLGDELGLGLYADIRGLGDALGLGLYADIRGLGDALKLGLYADVRNPRFALAHTHTQVVHHSFAYAMACPPSTTPFPASVVIQTTNLDGSIRCIKLAYIRNVDDIRCMSRICRRGWKTDQGTGVLALYGIHWRPGPLSFSVRLFNDDALDHVIIRLAATTSPTCPRSTDKHHGDTPGYSVT